MEERSTAEEKLTRVFSELKDEARSLKLGLEALSEELTEEIDFLKWQLKWYNLWTFCIPTKWAKQLYKRGGKR